MQIKTTVRHQYLSMRMTEIKNNSGQAWWLTPVIPSLGKQRQEASLGLHREFQANLGNSGRACGSMHLK
jgi:hypothetical protein